MPDAGPQAWTAEEKKMSLALLSFLIAVYAAILSTINLYTQRKDKQSRIAVKTHMGFLGAGQSLSDAMLFIAASNPVHKPVVVNTSGFLLPDGSEMVFLHPESNVTFPFELTPEHNCQTWTDLKSLARQLKGQGFGGTIKLVGFYRDAVGRKHESKPYKLDIETWA